MSVSIESLAFNLQLKLLQAGYLDPPFSYQQHGQLQAQWQQDQAATFMFHQQRNQIQASVFQEQKDQGIRVATGESLASVRVAASARSSTGILVSFSTESD
jgi:hypothetical protein